MLHLVFKISLLTRVLNIAVWGASRRPGLWSPACSAFSGRLTGSQSSGRPFTLDCSHCGHPGDEEEPRAFSHLTVPSPRFGLPGCGHAREVHHPPPEKALHGWGLILSFFVFKTDQKYVPMSQVSITNLYSASTWNGKISLKNQTSKFLSAETLRLLL